MYVHIEVSEVSRSTRASAQSTRTMVSWLLDLDDVIPGQVGEGVRVRVGPLRQEQLDFREVPDNAERVHVHTSAAAATLSRTSSGDVC